MLETNGIDIFDQIDKADAVCITTNCSVFVEKTLNINPMGALAGAAANRWEDIPYLYARGILQAGAVPLIIGFIDKKEVNKLISFSNLLDVDYNKYTALVAYPTMYKIGQPADLALVERSATLLLEMANRLSWTKIYLGAPGIGVGGLNYLDVKSKLTPIFDNRFVVMQK